MKVIIREHYAQFRVEVPLKYKPIIDMVIKISDRISRCRISKKGRPRTTYRPTKYYSQLKADVYAIHEKKCDKCSSTGKLTMHHLNSWSSEPDFRFDPDSVGVLCRTCHEEFHKKYGYIGFTPLDFIEFLSIETEESKLID